MTVAAVDDDRPCMHLRVLRCFELRCEHDVLSVPPNVERVLAFLAVRERPQLRSTVASTLWIDTTDDRAAANLRSALWKARQISPDCVDVNGSYVSLSAEVVVDLTRVIGQAKRLMGGDGTVDEQDTDTDALIGDLLPDWDEDWIIFERERLRQLRVHALESLCRRLSSTGRHGEAIDAGLAAVAAEPLRESAQRVLIEAHLAEGNFSEARRQFALYRDVLNDGLGLEPSSALRAIVMLPR